jgi:hypothetical protein
MKSSNVRDAVVCSTLKVNRRFGGIYRLKCSESKSETRMTTCLLRASSLFLAWLTDLPWKWSLYVPPKRRFTLIGLHSAIFQKNGTTLEKNRNHSCIVTFHAAKVYNTLIFLVRSVRMWAGGGGGSAVGIATAYELDDRKVGVQVPVGSEFSLLHIVHTGSRVHPASYPKGTGSSFPGGKAAGSWIWPFTSS